MPESTDNHEKRINRLLQFSLGIIHKEDGNKLFTLTLKQAILLLNTLPVDITFIDEFDKVRYFSSPKDRFFTRSKAIIGRDVQNCHPPGSVKIVNQLLESFRSGKKASESFWIQVKGKFILIRYFALRDKSGKYKGTIEVSQDITDIKNLTGEKKLFL